ncbi:hypothetical protein QF042_000264 [Pedobacter sp. W3I1]|uniref:hypothetical protein n=1 Tax=Pedobacter sp. W3I1 TaxID=3042291 RepID=UPI00278AC2C2|nr:hypothetical protein [Pedobacter sp. W3I1]MDQ0636699.1 hypothetical protein [Pedobacter sp. W3I1]
MNNLQPKTHRIKDKQPISVSATMQKILHCVQNDSIKIKKGVFVSYFSSLREGFFSRRSNLSCCYKVLIFLESKVRFFIGCISPAFPAADRKPVKQASIL